MNYQHCSRHGKCHSKHPHCETVGLNPSTFFLLAVGLHGSMTSNYSNVVGPQFLYISVRNHLIDDYLHASSFPIPGVTCHKFGLIYLQLTTMFCLLELAQKSIQHTVYPSGS